MSSEISSDIIESLKIKEEINIIMKLSQLPLKKAKFQKNSKKRFMTNFILCLSKIKDKYLRITIQRSLKTFMSCLQMISSSNPSKHSTPTHCGLP
jgi:hypothetical protein